MKTSYHTKEGVRSRQMGNVARIVIATVVLLMGLPGLEAAVENSTGQVVKITIVGSSPTLEAAPLGGGSTEAAWKAGKKKATKQTVVLLESVVWAARALVLLPFFFILVVGIGKLVAWGAGLMLHGMAWLYTWRPFRQENGEGSLAPKPAEACAAADPEPATEAPETEISGAPAQDEPRIIPGRDLTKVTLPVVAVMDKAGRTMPHPQRFKEWSQHHFATLKKVLVQHPAGGHTAARRAALDAAIEELARESMAQEREAELRKTRAQAPTPAKTTTPQPPKR